MKNIVLLIGYGKSGKAVESFLKNKRFDVLVYDDEHCEPANYIRAIKKFDFVVVSPGVCPRHPIVVSAKKNGIQVFSEIEVVYRLRDNKRKTLVGVTGTNGKTTIVSMIYAVLGDEAVPCGNYGLPWAECAERTNSVDIIELSSFQLENIQSFCPDIAVFSNIKPDHLEWHGGFENYFKAKLNVFKNQTKDSWAVVNEEDETLLMNLNFLKSKVVFVGFHSMGDHFCILKDDYVVYTRDGVEERVFRIDKIKLVGRHNVINMLMAVAVLKILGVSNVNIETRLSCFKLDRYRLEEIENNKGIVVVNDSKSTNLASLIVAIKAYEQKAMVVLVGGIDKGEAFDELFSCSKNVKEFVFFGQAREKLIETAKKCGVLRFSSFEDFRKMIEYATKKTEEGDVLLFSPACASFDMFSDYKHRGEVFEQAIKEVLS